MNLGGVLGRMRLGGQPRKVLLVDYDPQFNLSQCFIPPETYYSLEEKGKHVLAVLQDDDTVLDPYHIQVSGNLSPPKVCDVSYQFYAGAQGTIDIVPSTLDLMYVALGQSDLKAKPLEERFQKFILECRSKYDLVFIDCHPAGSVFTKTSLQNSDHVLIPVVPERFAVRGIGLMLQFINAKKHGSQGPTPHILFNMTPRVGVRHEERRIRLDPKFRQYCMTETLKRYKAFADPFAGSGFVWTSGRSWSTQAYLNLCAVAWEFLARIGVG
jgi:chromosome partitioning protein